MTHKELKTKLKRVIQEEPFGLKAEVAHDWLDSLDDYDKPEGWYNDLQQGGCQSGFVGRLIYYADTHKFFDKHYDEIEELREWYEEETGGQLAIKGDLKNWLAWFGYEGAAHKLADELGIEG